MKYIIKSKIIEHWIRWRKKTKLLEKYPIIKSFIYNAELWQIKVKKIWNIKEDVDLDLF